MFIFKIYRLTEGAKCFFFRLHCMCQHLQITLFSLILSFHLSLMPLKRFHLGDVSFCLEQIQMPVCHTHCDNQIQILLYNQTWRINLYVHTYYVRLIINFFANIKYNKQTMQRLYIISGHFTYIKR